MARAKRHYLPGQIWHLTHRCHKREHEASGLFGARDKMMNIYIIIMSVIVAVMYVFEIVSNGTKIISVEQYVCGISFAALAFVSASCIKKWYGIIPIIGYFILNGLAPFFLGSISGIIKSKLLNRLLLAFCGSLPVIAYMFACTSYSQGRMNGGWEPTIVKLIFAVLKSGLWFVAFLYFNKITKQMKDYKIKA